MLPNELPNENEPAPEPASIEAQPAAAPAIPQPPQNFATRDDLMAVMDSVKAIAAAVQQGVATRNAPAAPAIPEISDDEIMASINEGKPTTALRKLADNLKASIIQEHIAPLSRANAEAMASLVKDAAKVAPDMPHFAKLEKQIDALLQGVPVEQRANPATYRTAYAIAAGQNITTIVNEAVEQAMRKATLDDGGSLPGGGIRPAGSGAVVPTVAELCGADAEAALKAQGWTPDQYAQKILHAPTWAVAAQKIQKFNEEHPSNA